MQRGRRGKVAAGIFPGTGPVPYGYVKAGLKEATRLEIVPETADVVRQIYCWFVHDRLTMAEIARRLQARGILPPGKPDYAGRKAAPTLWRSSTVRNMLSHEVYAGIYYANRYQKVSARSSGLRPREEWIPIGVPAIVDRVLWDAAQEHLANGRSRAHTRAPYLMRSRLRCSCGYAAFGTAAVNNKGQVYHYYECGQRHRSWLQCEVGNTSAEKVDLIVWNRIRALLHAPHAVASTDGHIRAIEALAREVGAEPATADFEQRRRLIEELNISGTLAREDGQRVLYMHWYGTTEKLWVDQEVAADDGVY